jgi:AcrR family transcriptional regulator
MPPRRTRYHHGDVVAAVTSAARAAIARDGHEHVSLRAIAAAAGVSHVAVVHHFASREGVLAAVAADVFRELTAGVAEVAGAAPPRRAFRAVGEHYLRWALAHPALYRLAFGSGAWRTTEHAGLRAGAAQLLAAIAGEIRELGDAPEAAIDRALFAWSAAHGAALLLLDNRALVDELHRGSADRLIAIVLDGVFAGVAPRRRARRS